MKYPMGRKSAKATYRSVQRQYVMTGYLNALGTPPAESPDWVSAVTKQTPNGWLMFDNGPDPSAPAPLAQGMGDCVAASTFHQDMLRTANVGTVVIPTTEQVLAFYAILQGFTGDPTNAAAVLAFLEQNDNGANELDCEQILTKSGYLGVKLDASANLDPKQLDQLRWGVCIFGATRLGLNLPDSAQDQFSNGQPWDYVPGAQLAGGHDVPVVQYGPGIFYVVTWGQIQPVTEAFMTAKYPDGTPYVEEAHCELAYDWVNAKGTCPANLDLKQLVADLAAIVEPSPSPQPKPVPLPPSPPPSPTPKLSKSELAYLVTQAAMFDAKNVSMNLDAMIADLAAILDEAKK